MKILQVVFKMGRGGLETWIMNVLRRIDRQKCQMDFLVETHEKQAYDDEILSLGSRILRIRPSVIGVSYFSYLRDFRMVLKEYGPYEVVHVHSTVRRGFELREAAKAGVPVRIIHSHSVGKHDSRLITLPFCALGRYYMHKYATDGLGCSRNACARMFGKNWSADTRYRPLYYGIDMNDFKDRKKDGPQVRKEFNISPNAKVVGHVGRFFKVKNHDFIVDIARELIRWVPDIRFLLVGDGPEKDRIVELVGERRLTDYFVFSGERSDVARMFSAMDVFVLPSLWEGLAMVLLEAQAMGLPCLITHSLPSEVDVIEGLCHRLPLASGPEIWAQKLVDLVENCLVEPSKSFDIVKNSYFNIETSVNELVKVYERT